MGLSLSPVHSRCDGNPVRNVHTPQLEENIRTFSTEEPLNEQEKDTLLDMAYHMTHTVPCTACHYCTSHCPQELDIPGLIGLYNEHTFTSGETIDRPSLAPFRRKNVLPPA